MITTSLFDVVQPNPPVRRGRPRKPPTPIPIPPDEQDLDAAFNRLLPEVVAEETQQFQPTECSAGSDEKIQVMQERYERGLPLFHPR